MWRFPPFQQFLADLLDCDQVGEVLLYDNDPSKTPEQLNLGHSRLRYYNFGENKFVNPPWNWGVRGSINDQVLILNDDVLFDFKVFQRVKSLSDPNAGVVGICPGRPEFNQPEFTNGNIDLIPWRTGMHTFGFGCMMFVNKKWYRPIPAGLDIYYGDNWIFDTCLRSGQTNYMITNMFHYTPYATTTKDRQLVGSRLDIESEIYRRELAKFGN